MLEIKIKCTGSNNISLKKIDDYQGNLKEISEENLNKLKNSIIKHGFIQPFAIWKNPDGLKKILDGHQRKIALLSLEKDGYKLPKQFPSYEVEAETELEAKKILLQKVSEYGQVTKQGLFDFINEIGIDFDTLDEFNLANFDIEEFKIEFPDIDVSDYIQEEKIEKEEEFDLEEAIDEIKEPKTKLGDIYQLGNHRLMCGDCTDKNNLEKLLNGNKVDSLVTDPPYGVDYSSKNEFLNKFDEGNRIQTPIENDKILDYRKFFNDFLKIIPFSDYNTFYICMSGQELHNLRLAIEDSGLKCCDYLVWVKNNHVLGRKDYNTKHEFITYGWKNHHKFYGNFSTTVLEYNKPLKNDLHPTMKPVELIKKLITDGSKQNDNIYEPFCGSGTTLIACEETNRNCYALELSPVYCDVIINRWENLTNKKVELIGNINNV